MKKFFLMMAAGAALIIVSCSDKKETGGMSDKAKKNLESVKIVVNAFETGDVSKIDECIDPAFIDHTERGDLGKDSLKAMITTMHTAMPDLKFNLVREMADDEYTMSWYRMTGTSDGSMGMPKGPFSMNSIDVVKYKDNKAIEHWSFGEMREVMQMMMGAQQPPVEEKKDSIPPVK